MSRRDDHVNNIFRLLAGDPTLKPDDEIGIAGEDAPAGAILTVEIHPYGNPVVFWIKKESE